MNSKTFCAATWTHLDITSTGTLQPCCVWNYSGSEAETESYYFTEFDQWLNSAKMKTIRKDLHNGQARKECNHCYKLDQSNITSQRVIYNAQFARYNDYSILDTETWTANPDELLSIDLKLGNLCDLKCVMCNGRNSSQIMTEYKLHKARFDEIEGTALRNADDNFKWPLSDEFKQFISRFKSNLKDIKMTGGEPTIIPYVIEFLESIEAPEEVTLNLVTNASSYNEKLFNVISKFKLVNIAISLEGIGEANELLRFNSEWAIIVENIARYNAMPNVCVTITHVIQAFSVATVIPLIKWCEEQGLRLALGVLNSPKNFRLDSVPLERIEQFIAELSQLENTITRNRNAVESIIDIAKKCKYDPLLETSRKKYTILLDDLRKTKLSSII